MLALVVVLGCAEAPADPGGSDSGDAPEPADLPWPLPRTCVAPAGLGRPSTIDAVVELVNALPKPTSLPCVLESLDRPLSVYASSSTAGAQPATGPDNPRIFVLEGDLVMSVVPAGDAAETLELALAIGERLSIKAELSFPEDEVLAAGAPYSRVSLGVGTSCGLCHGNEVLAGALDDGTRMWASDVLQDEGGQAVSLSFLRQNALDCDHDATPDRCAMYDALFGHGEVVPGDLDRTALLCQHL